MQDPSAEMTEEQKKKRKSEESDLDTCKRQKPEVQDLPVDGKQEKKEAAKLVPDKECEFIEEIHLTKKGKTQMEFAGIECSVCKEVPAEVITAEGCDALHVHCRICLDKMERSGYSRKCSICRQWRVFSKNEVLSQQRNRVETRCAFHDRFIDEKRPGCKTLIPLGDWVSHVQRCEYSIFECGPCGDAFYASAIKEHQTKCPKVTVACDKCQEMVKRSYMPTHIEINCIKQVTKAPCCGQEMAADQVDLHLNECPEMLVPCELGCPMEIKRGAMEEHLKFNDMKTHYINCRAQLKAAQLKIQAAQSMNAGYQAGTDMIKLTKYFGVPSAAQTPAASPSATEEKEVSAEEFKQVEAVHINRDQAEDMHTILMSRGFGSELDWNTRYPQYVNAVTLAARIAKFYHSGPGEVARQWEGYRRSRPLDQQRQINCRDLRRMIPMMYLPRVPVSAASSPAPDYKSQILSRIASAADTAQSEAPGQDLPQAPQPLNLGQRRVVAPAPSPFNRYRCAGCGAEFPIADYLVTHSFACPSAQ